MTQGRGNLSNTVQAKAKEMIGREINMEELRLVPYIHFVMTNDQAIDPMKINEDERKILRKWKDAGYCEGGASGMTVTKEFFDFMNEVLWIAYVDIE